MAGCNSWVNCNGECDFKLVTIWKLWNFIAFNIPCCDYAWTVNWSSTMFMYFLCTHWFSHTYTGQVFYLQIFNLKDNIQSPLPSHLANLWESFPHPGLITFTVILWVTPTLTLDRWLLATVLSWYIYVPRRVTKKDYIYFCECYNYVEHSEAHLSYWKLDCISHQYILQRCIPFADWVQGQYVFRWTWEPTSSWSHYWI